MGYEIIATLGPSSSTAAIWNAMLQAGATAFRLNTSHLSLPQLHTWLGQIHAFYSTTGSRFPVVLDLQGSKWRLGDFPPFELVSGKTVEILQAGSLEQTQTLPVPHADFFKAAETSGQDLLLNDAKIHLKIISIGPDSILAEIIRGGEISPRKGITFADSTYRIETLREKDQAIMALAQPFDFVRYAVSYVKDSAEMERYRSFFGPDSYLIAKIERRTAVDEGERIALHANELWLCRGDLGAELGMRAMAEAVNRFSRLPAKIKVPVLMAGQVLEHMVASTTPTRSEICCLYENLAAGYRGFVLSDEAAIGLYPVESCRTAAIFKE